MPNYWKIPGVPHKGWRLIDVEDIREDGQSELDTDYECCMMCGHEKIRYVHVVYHNDERLEFRVGCNCAEKMTGDYVNPERREKELRNRTNRRQSWNKKVWRINEKGNLILKYDNHRITIFRLNNSSQYKVVIDKTFGKKIFNDVASAKIAAFKGVEYLKEKGEW
jgi:hypothetical protein